MEGQPLVDWGWIGKHLGDIQTKIFQHLELLVIAMVAGFLISIALAIMAVRRPGTVGPVTAVTGLLYTIPSLAAFAVLRPILGLSLWTAIIPLATYTLLILYRNMVAGLRSVPAAVQEAALGMGYSRRARFLRVELPLAVPMIITGIRLATVTTIGLVTVASVIGTEKFGGLGQYITEGLQSSFPTKIYLGAVLSVLLAFVLDSMLVVLQRRLTPWAQARGERA